ncbi:hypothetical protein [Pseudobacteroides cellulosolvens]|uniref:Uncharacterized protein n=2 Tax=Pseudobacteroides cellulosolvens TaxID=35825 RepID=A0A0L6JKU6_9FIRM|nr:hypothetical protein [Pseudobacteroides cellulosolvens]KNY26385.1 hypothetical protein Bccel_1647 [Pseudobacteroides cellulosolvens ATCC 35603 = DSM 2933]
MYIKTIGNRQKLYDVFWPIWIIILFPPFLFISMIVNYVIDSVVIGAVLIATKAQIEWKKCIIPISKAWFIGILIDVLASISLLILEESNVINTFNPLSCLSIVVFSGILIGLYNFKLFKKQGLEKRIYIKTAIAMGILTAPWLILLPKELQAAITGK